MKIEKVNENQIRCVLTKEDLADRQIRLSELAYGSEKAKSLFRDMIQQANYEFGFEANDIPLMIEAIPVTGDTIILVITKVEYAEELDTRFSKFSESDADVFEQDGLNSDDMPVLHGADDILGLFNKIRQEHQKSKEERKEAGEEPSSSTEGADIEPEVVIDLIKMFEFHSIAQVEQLAKVLNGFYVGENDLYKNEKLNRYYLVIHKSDHTPEEFNKACNIISEYASSKSYTPSVSAYFKEHGKVICRKEAIQTLALL